MVHPCRSFAVLAAAFTVFWDAGFVSGAWGPPTLEHCFDEADRVPGPLADITINGETGPLKLMTMEWPSGQLVARAAMYIIQDLMGIRVDDKSQTSPNSRQCPGALAGCTPQQADPGSTSRVFDPSCVPDPEAPLVAHACLEAWSSSFVSYLLLPERTRPEFVDYMGYQGFESIFLIDSVINAAVESKGADLQSYRAYNTSWHDQSPYFDSMVDILERFGPGSGSEDVGTLFHNDVVWQGYVDFTGDDTEVVTTDGKTIAKLDPVSNVWRSPACRALQDDAKCIPYVTVSSGWHFGEAAQYSVFFSMPLIIVLYPWDTYVEVCKTMKVLMYWWTPDLTYAHLAPKVIRFPKHNRNEQDIGLWRTDVAGQRLNAFTARKVKHEYTRIYDFFNKFVPDVNDADMDLLLEGLITHDNDYDQAACSWLKANRERVMRMIPSDCGVGEGTLPTGGCIPCEAGSLSTVVEGVRVCTDCPPGHYCGYRALEAVPCPKGNHCPEKAERPEKCELGEYADEERKQKCDSCPSGMVTLFKGAERKADCACAPDTFHSCMDASQWNCPATTLELDSWPVGTPFCSACPAGMECAGGFGANQTHRAPLLLPNYMAFPHDPLTVYKCQSKDLCPGGVVGTCGPHTTGISCASCETDYVMVRRECQKCETAGIPIAFFFVLLLVFAVLAVVGTYRMANSPITVQVTNSLMASMACGSLLTAVQSLGVMRQVSVPWPEEVAVVLDVFSVFVFDLSELKMGCVVSSSALGRYSVKILSPAFLISCVLFAAVLFRQQGVSINKCINTLGQLWQTLYILIVLVTVTPLQCYSHPTGNISSLFGYPDVLCWDSGEHTALLVLGLLGFAVYVLGYFCICAYYVMMAPILTSQDPKIIVRFRFLFYKFRPDRWWWSLVFSARNGLVAFAPALNSDDGQFQVTVVALVCCVYLSLQCRYWPWRQRSLNIADSAISLVILTTCSAASAFLPRSDSADNYAIFLATLIVIMLIGLSSFVFMMLFNFYREKSHAPKGQMSAGGAAYNSTVAAASQRSSFKGGGESTVRSNKSSAGLETLQAELSECCAQLGGLPALQRLAFLSKLNEYDRDTVKQFAGLVLVSLNAASVLSGGAGAGVSDTSLSKKRGSQLEGSLGRHKRRIFIPGDSFTVSAEHVEHTSRVSLQEETRRAQDSEKIPAIHEF